MCSVRAAVAGVSQAVTSTLAPRVPALNTGSPTRGQRPAAAQRKPRPSSWHRRRWSSRPWPSRCRRPASTRPTVALSKPMKMTTPGGAAPSVRCQCVAAVGAPVQLVQADQQGGRGRAEHGAAGRAEVAGAAVKCAPPSVEVTVNRPRCRARRAQAGDRAVRRHRHRDGVDLALAPLPRGHGSPTLRQLAPASVEANSTELAFWAPPAMWPWCQHHRPAAVGQLGTGVLAAGRQRRPASRRCRSVPAAQRRCSPGHSRAPGR